MLGKSAFVVLVLGFLATEYTEPSTEFDAKVAYKRVDKSGVLGHIVLPPDETGNVLIETCSGDFLYISMDEIEVSRDFC